ncbi:6-hydroxynicotinate 3-monooxygenase [Cyphellophora attinorum]|uniref:6-hydroxynicotinate 3-monooxygenase n=1 Tax=Cyphellophora attinorum TaxID=1664694 RepID=A0A0N1GYK1_9EURO|nr:6-hydroxynicotinate 3-monooxygenase [Phialophora attinorum]KPI35784.1 6-hydroxynicotinate 3-monooxygenase [Phialophora attinorum]
MASEGHARLQVGIIGCGIAGLSAAIALSRAGHDVEVYERSTFSNETGAAIILGPNATRVLTRWGFDAEKAGGLDFCQMRRIKADTLELDSEQKFSNIKEKYGDRMLLLHRADLHTGIMSIVEALPEPKPKIHLGSAVKDMEPEQGSIILENGSTVSKDLVIVADGSHSRLIPRITGSEAPVIRLPMSMYRFLQPISDIMDRPEAAQFYKDQQPGFSTFYKAAVGKPGHLLNTYPCRRGFHPAVKAICEGATDVKVYNQMYRNPIETFVKRRAVLVGDAAHLMLPTHGQGASSAIEDAMALEVLLKGVSSDQVVDRLQLFNELRLPRVRAVQTFSNKMMGPPDKMIQEVKQYFSGPIPAAGSKTFGPEFVDFFLSYDVKKAAEQLLKV